MTLASAAHQDQEGWALGGGQMAEVSLDGFQVDVIREVWPEGRGRGSAPLLCAVRPHLEHGIQMGCAQCRRDMELLESVQRRATKMIQEVGTPLL